MLVHGDATPAPLFKLLADRLVAKGCRLIAFGKTNVSVSRITSRSSRILLGVARS